MERRSASRWLIPTIQNKLLVLMLVVALVPLLVLGTLAYLKSRESIINQVGERLQAESLLAMSLLDRTFGFSFENVMSWAELDVMQAVERGDPEGVISEMLTEYQEAYGIFINMAAVDLDGVVVAGSDSDLIGISVVDTHWFKTVMSSGRPHMSALRFDPELGGYGVGISVPITRRYDSSVVIGVLKVSLGWNELLNQINQIKVLPDGQQEMGYAVLIDSEGYILAAPDFILDEEEGSYTEENALRVHGHRWWPAQSPLLLDRLLHRAGHRYVRRGDTDYLLVNMPAKQFKYIGETGWGLVLIRDANDALKDVVYIRERGIIIGIFSTCFILIVAYLLSRQIGQPISRLSSWAEEISHGNLDRSISLRSKDELAQLASSLDNMRQNLKNYLDELYQSRERYEAVMSSIDCVVWEAQINPPQISLLSGNVEHVIGRTAEDAAELLSNWRGILHSDHHDTVMEAFRFAVGEASDNYVECKVRHGDGHWMWVKVLISVVIEGLSVERLRGVVVDISENMKAAEDMAVARDLAIKTAEDKSRFMAIVSHEIRTPMNGILGMLDMFNESGINEEQKEVLALARASGRNLLALVDDVMDFSRMESGELEFNYEETDVHELLNSTLSLIAMDSYRTGLDVGVVMEAGLPQKLITDPTKLRQVLAGLLSNAVKFTNHGSILLWAELLPTNRLYVEVKDTGVGIDATHQTDLFEPFVQEDGSSTRRFGGSGLGLALCQGIIQAMGGKIGVKSIKNVGSSFFFELPVEVPSGQEALMPRLRRDFQREYADAAVLLIGDMPATQMVLQMACNQWELDFHWEPKETRLIRNLDAVLAGKNYHWIFIAQEISDRFWEALAPYLSQPDAARVIQLRSPTDRYGQRPLPHIYLPFSTGQLAETMMGQRDNRAPAPLSSVPSAAVSNKLPRVLVVDDNEVNRRVACGYLRKLGFSSDIAEDGMQALDAVKRNNYGLVFMDCQMPVMDGYEATQAIRQFLDGQRLPIIAVTANAMEGDREKCLNAGMDDYIAKPLRKEKVREVVSRWVPTAQIASG